MRFITQSGNLLLLDYKDNHLRWHRKTLTVELTVEEKREKENRSITLDFQNTFRSKSHPSREGSLRSCAAGPHEAVPAPCGFQVIYFWANSRFLLMLSRL